MKLYSNGNALCEKKNKISQVYTRFKKNLCNLQISTLIYYTYSFERAKCKYSF